MAGMLEYKCPCCDGAIQFDSATQKMKCPYCDTEFDVDTLKGYDEELKDEKPSEMNWATPGGSWAEGETAGLHTYSCKSCGGEIVGDDTMAASACPFCGNPIVLTGQFAGALRPDLIIPFKLDKKAAKAKLQEHLKGKTLLPKVFRSQNHIDEIKGVYVPFWLYDSDADAQLRFTATRTRCWSDSKYDYTETNYYSVRRDGTLGFDAVPVDGSSKIEDDLMESIEPFAMQDAVPVGTGGMAAVLALDAEKVKAVCAEVTAQLGGAEVVEAVNFNDPGQTVIAGHKGAVERAMDACKARGAKMAKALPVSAPFHSSLIRPAADKLAARLAELSFNLPAIPVINNVDVTIESDPARATGPLMIYAAHMRNRALGRAGAWLLRELQARLG